MKLNLSDEEAYELMHILNSPNFKLRRSQRDLADTFGDPVFETDASNNAVHAGELNEYGLQAAYSYLGISNAAFVTRADVDTNQLKPKITILLRN